MSPHYSSIGLPIDDGDVELISRRRWSHSNSDQIIHSSVRGVFLKPLRDPVGAVLVQWGPALTRIPMKPQPGGHVR